VTKNDQAAVTRYMIRLQEPPSQGWKTFLRNHAAGIASIDLFVVHTISFKLLFALVSFSGPEDPIIVVRGRAGHYWLSPA
jgi:hypothetical protein